MLKLFQFIVWAFVVWQLIVIQIEEDRGVDLLATFILGGMCAYWATGFLILFRILASRVVALVHLTLRRLFLLEKPHQLVRTLIAEQRRQLR